MKAQTLRAAVGSYTRKSRGFTLIELCVVIIVLGILLSVIVDSSIDYYVQSTDKERVSDIDVISNALERYYRTEAVATGATYPTASIGLAGLVSIIDNAEATIAPDETTTSLKIATNKNNQTPTTAEYIYQPFDASNNLCTTAPCVRFKLYYRLEETNTVISRDSLRQQ